MRQGSCRWTKMQPRHQQLHPNTRAGPQAALSAGTGSKETSYTKPGISGSHRAPSTSTAHEPCPCHGTPNGSSWQAVLIRVSQDVTNTGRYPSTGPRAISGAQGWQRDSYPCSSQSPSIKRKQMFKRLEYLIPYSGFKSDQVITPHPLEAHTALPAEFG